MTEEKHEKTYPIKSLHDFLFELDREWSKFRTGALISMIASSALLVFFVLRFLLLALRRLDLVDVMFLVFVAIFLIYSIYAMFAQYRFFNRWERRMGLLLHLEEELMSKKLGE
jgi:membrane protein implicated in regulation of membrane protease activity